MTEAIDRVGLKTQLYDAYCANCDDWNGVKCRCCLMNDALIAIEEAPQLKCPVCGSHNGLAKEQNE